MVDASERDLSIQILVEVGCCSSLYVLFFTVELLGWRGVRDDSVDDDDMGPSTGLRLKAWLLHDSSW